MTRTWSAEVLARPTHIPVVPLWATNASTITSGRPTHHHVSRPTLAPSDCLRWAQGVERGTSRGLEAAVGLAFQSRARWR